MRSLQKFTGLNNVKPAEELGDDSLTLATNVDLDLEGHASRRAGFVKTSSVRHANLWKANGFTVATRGAAGDLVNVDTNTVLLAGVSHNRMWFVNLPNGRTLFSNETYQGTLSATEARPWGVPTPASLGSAADTAGNLFPGKYQWALTHVRLVDGIEGAPAYSNAGAIDIVLGGIALTSLPVPTGYKTRIYLTSHYGGERFFAGETTTSTFTFTGFNRELQLRCPTDLMQPPPVGRLVAFWRGRVLIAVGNVLFASPPNAWEVFNWRRDFKQFSGTITMVQPVQDGVWIGTASELCFLEGKKWDDLERRVRMPKPVVLGSGCTVPGEYVRAGDSPADAECMVCIAGGWIVAGLPSGELVPITKDRYSVTASGVAAAFRVVGGVPQYVAQVL
jgi:hypothetical protein